MADCNRSMLLLKHTTEPVGTVLKFWQYVFQGCCTLKGQPLKTQSVAAAQHSLTVRRHNQATVSNDLMVENFGQKVLGTVTFRI